MTEFDISGFMQRVLESMEADNAEVGSDLGWYQAETIARAAYRQGWADKEQRDREQADAMCEMHN